MKTSVIEATYTTTRKCDYCRAEEDKIRPVGQFEVHLTSVSVFGEEKLACQSCIHKEEEIKLSRLAEQNERSEDAQLFHLKKFISMFVHACFLLLTFSVVIMAQPPGMPGAPDQAPIDGGLSLLAAAGGAYAVKKLRDKKRAGEEELE